MKQLDEGDDELDILYKPSTRRPPQLSDIHTGFFPPIRHFFPRTSDRTGWYPRSDFHFSVGPMVRTYTTNIPTL